MQRRGRVPKDTSGRVLSGPRVDSVAAEIKKLQSPDWASRHLIPKTAFIRIVQEILQERYPSDKRRDVKFTIQMPSCVFRKRQSEKALTTWLQQTKLRTTVGKSH